ncbi:hypothetical protein N7G274_003800 [Stereocaulon virgatum]|uniref:Heterokaryon incompatibility domain-containing protein n=1 Tax=Stereocaulon virgatum TaxID=373712 RepID=A0ABR4AJ87_9LECA
MMSTSKQLEPTALTGRYCYCDELEGENIRLLKLTPGLATEQISCHLVYKRLDEEDLEYNALSYVWGDASDLTTMLCDGLLFQITRNLHDALSQIRLNRHETLLWVDAVCIDQANKVEKTRQVRLMTEIYSQAELVLIWLGDELATDKDGVQLMRKVEQVLGQPTFDRRTFGTTYLDLEALGLPDMFDPCWATLVKILTRQWFTRMWTIQELVLARQAVFLCGPVEIRSSSMLHVAGNFSKFVTLKNVMGVHATVDSAIHASNASALCSLASTFSASRDVKLLNLLWLTRNFKATDPRDGLFALVALTEDVKSTIIDYKRSLRDVLIQLAILVLTSGLTKLINTKPLCLLSYVEAATRRPDLPSWVPEWKSRDPAFRPLSLILPARTSIDYGDGSFSVNLDKTLNVRGKFIGKLKTIVQSTPYLESLAGSSAEETQSKASQMHAWNVKVSQLVRTAPCSSQYVNVAEARWRTLCFNGGAHEPAPPETASAFEAWQQTIDCLDQLQRASRFSEAFSDLRFIWPFVISGFWLGYGALEAFRRRIAVSKTLRWSVFWLAAYGIGYQSINLIEYLVGPDLSIDRSSLISRCAPLPKKAESFEQAFGRYCGGRRFCVTEQGYMGWVSLAAREGDEVATFYGTRLLHTLRRESRGFRLTGDCYLQGLMEGEAATLDCPEADIRII